MLEEEGRDSRLSSKLERKRLTEAKTASKALPNASVTLVFLSFNLSIKLIITNPLFFPNFFPPNPFANPSTVPAAAVTTLTFASERIRFAMAVRRLVKSPSMRLGETLSFSLTAVRASRRSFHLVEARASKKSSGRAVRMSMGGMASGMMVNASEASKTT